MNFAPRIGLAWKPRGNKTVVRAGYGINYNLGQYGSIVQNLAAQPPFSFTETNAAPATGPSTFTMANGFPASTATRNNYGVDPNYRVAYVQLWNLNVQRELSSTVLLNVGYTGSKGTALDMLRAPNRGPAGYIPSVESFTWETSQGSKYSARRFHPAAQAHGARLQRRWNVYVTRSPLITRARLVAARRWWPRMTPT